MELNDEQLSWLFENSEIVRNLFKDKNDILFNRKELSNIQNIDFKLIFNYRINNDSRNYNFSLNELFLLINYLNFLCISVDDVMIFALIEYKNNMDFIDGKSISIIKDWLKYKNINLNDISEKLFVKYNLCYAVEYLLKNDPKLDVEKMMVLACEYSHLDMMKKLYNHDNTCLDVNCDKSDIREILSEVFGYNNIKSSEPISKLSLIVSKNNNVEITNWLIETNPNIFKLNILAIIQCIVSDSIDVFRIIFNHFTIIDREEYFLFYLATNLNKSKIVDVILDKHGYLLDLPIPEEKIYSLQELSSYGFYKNTSLSMWQGL